MAALATHRSMSRPRLLALDIDGTLLDGTGRLRDVIRAGVSIVAASGVQVVLATGRSPWQGVREVAATLSLTGLQITTQGAVISDPVTGHLERVRWLTPDAYHEAVRFAERNDLHPLVGTLDGHIARRVPEGISFGPTAPTTSGGFRTVADLREAIVDRPIRVFLPTPAQEHRDLRERARRWFGADAAVVWSDLTGFEILAPSTDKGDAVRWLADARGIDLGAVAAVGDAANDTEMLSIVGRSAAMGAAPAEVQAAADIVVPSSDDDGLIVALADFFPDLARSLEALVEDGDRLDAAVAR